MSANQQSLSSSDELAARALRQMVADLADRLHDAIDAGLDVETLHNILGLWEANNLNEELTYEALVRWGAPTTCDGCGDDVTPYDDYGRPVEGGWEWYMVRAEVWEAAASSQGEQPRFLCIGCLEGRIGRQLTRADFADAEINKPGWVASERLMNRLDAA
jgi:hypothetical protein